MGSRKKLKVAYLKPCDCGQTIVMVFNMKKDMYVPTEYDSLSYYEKTDLAKKRSFFSTEGHKRHDCKVRRPILDIDPSEDRRYE